MRPLRVWLLPIEPFEERYTEQWSRWWPAGLSAAGLDVRIVPGLTHGERAGGEFLDPVATWRWKGEQVAALAAAWPEVEDGDWILSLDGWGPATEAAAYMRDATGRRALLALFMHAGSYDPFDFLARKGMRRWALDVERGWLSASDLILLGSEAHARMILDNLGLDVAEKAVACGYPIESEELRRAGMPPPWSERPRRVVFPHRLAPEKQPEVFREVRRMYEERHPGDPVEWIRTRDLCRTKSEYYAILGSSRVAFSSALQETFGIAMQECAALGAHIVAPRRLSYPEVVRSGGLRALYGTLDEAVDIIHEGLGRESEFPWDGWHERAVARAADALAKRGSGVQR